MLFGDLIPVGSHWSFREFKDLNGIGISFVGCLDLTWIPLGSLKSGSSWIPLGFVKWDFGNFRGPSGIEIGLLGFRRS